MTGEQMEFPKTWEEYEKDYGFNDYKEVYTNNSRLIPSFRVKQWLDHLEQEPCEDCISREKAKQFLYERLDRLNDDNLYDIFSTIIDDMFNELPSVEQEPRKNEVILTKEEYGELVSSEFDNGYTKGYTEALEQNDVFDKIKAEIEQVSFTHYFEYGEYYGEDTREERIVNYDAVMQIIDKYRESEE